MEYDLILGLSIGLGMFIFASIAVVVTRGRNRKQCDEHGSAVLANTFVNPPTYDMAIGHYPSNSFYEKQLPSDLVSPHSCSTAQTCSTVTSGQHANIKPPSYEMAAEKPPVYSMLYREINRQTVPI